MQCVGVTEKIPGAHIEKADEPTGSISRKLSRCQRRRGVSIWATMEQKQKHICYFLWGALLQHIAFIWDGGDVFVPSAFPYQPRLGFLCRCCGAFSLAVVASKINILLMLSGDPLSQGGHMFRHTHTKQKSPLVILCTRGEELWMKIRADWKIALALPIRGT